MRVLVDTSVWSLALRRGVPATSHTAVKTLRKLIGSGEAVYVIGVILQEILQGVRDPAQAMRLKALLEPFPLLELERTDYEAAAHLYTQCRSHGIQAGSIDFLIAVAAIRHQCVLLSADRDFSRIARVSDLRLA